MNPDQIIIRPIVTEKTNMLREQEVKKYAFRVHPGANKIQIMQAVHSLFGVVPDKCNVVNVKSKPKSMRTRSGFRNGSTTAWKKAIVTMKQGETIDIFEGA